MSQEKLQAILAGLDRIRLATEAVVADLKIRHEVLAPFFHRPMPAADWLLELAKKSHPNNPGLLNFIAENMAEIPPARVVAKHYTKGGDLDKRDAAAIDADARKLAKLRDRKGAGKSGKPKAA
jgi:hypothetical protein